MAYESYSPVDLALDSTFRQWVLSPDPGLDAYWTAFVRQHPEKQPDLDEARRLITALRIRAEEPSPDELAAAWRTLVAENEQTVLVLPLWRRTLAWAAMFGLLVLSIAAYFLLHESAGRFVTRPGQTRSVQLPDGSTVVLNGNSRLDLLGDWYQSDRREVRLNGEAFFTVQKKADTDGQLVKFVVRTENAAVEVLGTQFDVHARRHQTRVVLKEGRVRLTEQGATPKTYTLRPGDLVTLTPQRPALRRQVRAERYDTWQHNRLVFDETTLTDVAQTLQDTYGVELYFDDPAADRQRFTGEFPTDRLDMLYQAIGEAFGYRVSAEGNRVIFSN